MHRVVSSLAGFLQSRDGRQRLGWQPVDAASDRASERRPRAGTRHGAAPLVAVCLGLCQCANVGGFDDFSAATTPVHACASLPTSKEDDSGLSLLIRVDEPALTCTWIDQKEVTVERYRRFLAAPPADQANWDSSYCAWKVRRSDPISDPKDECVAQILPHDEQPFAPDKPMRCIDFCDAQAFCRWEGKELCHQEDNLGLKEPSGKGSEWFMACTNTTTTVYPWGDDASEHHCNTGQTADSCTKQTRTCGVERGGEYSQCVTKTGVYDLLGNVDEWIYGCNSFAPADPSSPRECLTKGGGYDATVESCRLERTLPNDTRLPGLGFRCCAALTGPENRQRELGVPKD